MKIDYKELGKRIRAKRLQLAISQERLAEFADLSVPHVSHVETGNTKVSLPALVSISNALGVRIDELICDSVYHSRVIFVNEIADELKDCSEEEIRLIAEMVKALKAAYRKINP